MTRNVVIASGVRTAIGGFGGTLSGHAPTELGALCVAEALKRAGREGAQVDHVVFGNVLVTEPRDAYLARVAAVEGGVPVEVLEERVMHGRGRRGAHAGAPGQPASGRSRVCAVWSRFAVR